MSYDNIKFSIICPCYNQAHYLESAIQSVQAQIYKQWELLIVDDGSTDHTFNLAQKYAKNDSRIKIIQQSNRGLSAARNVGIKHASAKFLHFLDADDMIFPNAYDVIARKIHKNPEVSLWICSYTYFDEGDFHSRFFSENRLNPETIIKFNQAPPVAYFLKSSLINELGNFDESLKSCEDWDLWLRVAKSGHQIRTISELLVRYRYVSSSMSKNAKVMYLSLTEVTQRAVRVDKRIPFKSEFNRDLNWEVSPIFKNHFSQCLGILLHQGKIEEAVIWFQDEQKNWGWTFDGKDFKKMNSQLTFRYFHDKEQIQALLNLTLFDFVSFFKRIGYKPNEIKKIIKIIFEPQLKMNNHLKYGKFLGALLNKVRLY